MTSTDRVADHSYRVAVEERIRELIAWRAWYRARPDWGRFIDLSRQHNDELRALLRLSRQARRAALRAEHDLAHDETVRRDCRSCRAEFNASSRMAVGRRIVDRNGPTPQLAQYQAEGR